MIPMLLLYQELVEKYRYVQGSEVLRANQSVDNIVLGWQQVYVGYSYFVQGPEIYYHSAFSYAVADAGLAGSIGYILYYSCIGTTIRLLATEVEVLGLDDNYPALVSVQYLVLDSHY